MTDSPAMPSLLTIGHSDHEIDAFVALLVMHGVSAIADVRSSPYSRFHGQFNRETLAGLLKQRGIHYVFLGRELGARRSERECYEQGCARYERIAGLPAFHEGLDRLREGARSHRIALMCAEKDPITCHRTVLVCRSLAREGFDIGHILENGSIETHGQAEARMLEAVGLPSSHLFKSRAELVEIAYEMQGERIAYTESDASVAGGGAA